MFDYGTNIQSRPTPRLYEPNPWEPHTLFEHAGITAVLESVAHELVVIPSDHIPSDNIGITAALEAVDYYPAVYDGPEVGFEDLALLTAALESVTYSPVVIDGPPQEEPPVYITAALESATYSLVVFDAPATPTDLAAVSAAIESVIYEPA